MSFGPNKPRQIVNSVSMPSSLKVGTSLSSPSKRSAELTAKTRTSPDLTYSVIVEASVAITSALFPRSAATASPPPS